MCAHNNTKRTAAESLTLLKISAPWSAHEAGTHLVNAPGIGMSRNLINLSICRRFFKYVTSSNKAIQVSTTPA